MRAADRIGSVIASKYRLEKLVGEGGMGAVFCATHLTVGRRFAIKLLHADVTKHPDAKRRFTQEAQAAAKIGHPAILDVYDLGETDEGAPYMVMELLRGESLAERVKRGPLPVTEALQYGIGVLTALEAAHAAGIIHRDIKPANVFLIEGAQGIDAVRVLDFGIAKFQEAVDGAKTSTGAVLGSPHYMAPEQVRADADIDPRADVWAVGAMLYELLVGEPAHVAPTHAAVIAKIVLRAAPRVSERRTDVDERVDVIVARALAIDPAGRFSTAAAMREAIEEYLEVRAASVPPPSPRRLLPLAAAAVVIGAVAAGALFGKTPPPPAPAPAPTLTAAPAPASALASAPALTPASPSRSASASASTSASASLPQPPRAPTCPAGLEPSNGHCCPRGFVWQNSRCERAIAVVPPF